MQVAQLPEIVRSPKPELLLLTFGWVLGGGGAGRGLGGGCPHSGNVTGIRRHSPAAMGMGTTQQPRRSWGGRDRSLAGRFLPS